MIVESAQNETFKRFLSLTTSKGLKEEGLFLLSGSKLVAEFLAKPTLKVEYEILTPNHNSLTIGVRQFFVSPALFAQVDVLGTHAPILVVQQPEIPVLSEEDVAQGALQGIVPVVPIGDPGNLGAFIRSCEAFAVPRVILAREAAHPFLPKSVKASAGSVLRVPLARGPALAEFPPARSIALDMDGQSINDFVWPAQAYLLVGEEGPGFGAASYPTRICIPTAGVESLNVVVAGSIALSRIPQKK